MNKGSEFGCPVNHGDGDDNAYDDQAVNDEEGNGEDCVGTVDGVDNCKS